LVIVLLTPKSDLSPGHWYRQADFSSCRYLRYTPRNTKAK
jgi:hypothetical protein